MMVMEIAGGARKFPTIDQMQFIVSHIYTKYMEFTYNICVYGCNPCAGILKNIYKMHDYSNWC